VLYELLTGRLPFEGETPLAAASKRVMNDPAPLEHFREDIPAPLVDVVLLALRRDPSERFADANEFAQALRWSRERSPAMPPADRGAWVMMPQNRAATPPAEQAQPMKQPKAAADVDSDVDSEEEPPEQSTVLRVAPHVPGIDPEATPGQSSQPSQPSASADTSADAPADTSEDLPGAAPEDAIEAP
jgi:serine/threonine-protein kinase